PLLGPCIRGRGPSDPGATRATRTRFSGESETGARGRAEPNREEPVTPVHIHVGASKLPREGKHPSTFPPENISFEEYTCVDHARRLCPPLTPTVRTATTT